MKALGIFLYLIAAGLLVFALGLVTINPPFIAIVAIVAGAVIVGLVGKACYEEDESRGRRTHRAKSKTKRRATLRVASQKVSSAKKAIRKVMPSTSSHKKTATSTKRKSSSTSKKTNVHAHPAKVVTLHKANTKKPAARKTKRKVS